jgi:phosphoenolpyruvate synthase/pyruvate phosphate dikinase
MSTSLIKGLKEIHQRDIAIVGGKAANMGDLARGLKVPAGAQMRQIIIDLPFAPEVEQAISTAYQQLCSGKDPILVAVRSSATAEDRPDASFAGQLETYLDVGSLARY